MNMDKIKVSHNYSDIESGEEMTFVLKDQSILNDGPEEIYNEQIRAISNIKKNQIIKDNVSPI